LRFSGYWTEEVALTLTCDHLLYQDDGFSLACDFSLRKGTRTALIGPSGAGKSTLLDLVAGFRTPTRGRILWDGTDLTKHGPMKRPLSILFQDNNLFPHLTVAQNLSLALHPDRMRLTAEDRAKIDGALAQVSLHGMTDRKPGTLSGGQQSRVALARVLIERRPVLLLDEPFAALGPALRRDMLDLVVDLTGGWNATVLLVTHAPEDARRFADKTIVVAEGRAEPPQDTATLFANPSGALQRYLD
jgi:thiamine transport system ATP-binding protein